MLEVFLAVGMVRLLIRGTGLAHKSVRGSVIQPL